MGIPEPARNVILLMLIAFGGYMLFEGWRWAGGNRAQLTRGQFVRRMVGGVILLADLLMWYLADPLMTGRPARERLLYLLTATLFVVLPFLLAVREAFFVMNQYFRWREELAGKLGERAVEAASRLPAEAAAPPRSSDSPAGN